MAGMKSKSVNVPQAPSAWSGSGLRSMEYVASSLARESHGTSAKRVGLFYVLVLNICLSMAWAYNQSLFISILSYKLHRVPYVTFSLWALNREVNHKVDTLFERCLAIEQDEDGGRGRVR